MRVSLKRGRARGATTKCNVDDKRRAETRCQNDGTAKGNDMIGPLYAVQGMFAVLRFPPLESTPPSLPLSLSFCLPRSLSDGSYCCAQASSISRDVAVYDSLNASDAFSHARLNFVNGPLISSTRK